ncbi:AraC family transcriptional regulator [Cupriavidus neocaledonicus]|uniref:Helix-turn-helix domain-containing protein n=1 Tax=Cupriavidus neocaledonicus TaxID=1040979 RepID=A0A375HU74_9BURK|nr:AraC family transcriptional regulator [Cupriavidus neocaledonicus]SOZ38079.1 putative transcriptional regulator, AraC family [Cupriavidus neocaledonicus]SPD60280.1 Helix-turn-helix domain-containing protein [Cupriavidus neocaledonicus]
MTVLVRSASLTKYLGIARGAGLDPVRMVARAGLDQACLYTPDLRIPEQRLAQVLEASARETSCHSLGLMVGESWRLSDFGPVSLLLQHQPTLRDALAEIERYRHWLSDSIAILVTEHPGVAVLHVTLQTGRQQPGRQAMELTVAALHSLIRAMLGESWMPHSVHFAHAAPADLRLHRRLFGPRIEFGSDFDGLVLAGGDLDRVNPLADASLAGYARGFLDLQPGAGKPSIAADVRRTLNQLLPRGRGAVEQVAQSLGTSPRTLQRQLEQDGLTFSALVNEVRRELAQRHLQAPGRPLAQVATLLGFSEPSAFSRWFAAQFGKSPTRWRQDGA